MMPLPTAAPPARSWAEYGIEALGLAVFMAGVGWCATLLEAPGSMLHQALRPWPGLRRGLLCLAVGGLAWALAESGWGRRSGAHLNPAVTLAFYCLGRIGGRDALGYGLAQAVGAVAGLALVASQLHMDFSGPPIQFLLLGPRLPGLAGLAGAFAVEAGTAYFLLLLVLAGADWPALARLGARPVAALLVFYMWVAVPISGFGMNPARALASALLAHSYASLWLYLCAPPLGMLLAAGTYGPARRHLMGVLGRNAFVPGPTALPPRAPVVGVIP